MGSNPSSSAATRSISAIWLSSAAILTTATQLREAALPLGPGEFLLVAWLGVEILTLVARRRVSLSPLVAEVGFFWLVALSLLGFGWIQALRIGVWEAMAYHDVVAYLFVFCVALFVAQWADADSSLRAIRAVTMFSAATLLCLLLAGYAYPVIGPLEIWYEGDVLRFRGWASNPNQTALLICPLPFFATYLFARSHTIAAKAMYFAAFLLLLVVGEMTGSDALTAAWVVSILVLALSVFVQGVRARQTGYWRPVMIKILVPIGLLTLVIAVGVTAGDDLAGKLMSALDSGNQASTRLTLWRHGIEAILTSPVFGLGPGAYSGVEAPFLGTEAHNTLVDWGMSTGISGIALLLSAYAVVLWRMRTRSPLLFGAVLALFGFSLFHYVLRQPIFWLYLILAMNLKPSPKFSGVGAMMRTTCSQKA